MTSQNRGKERRHDKKTIQNADARPEIPLFHILTHKKCAYLMCQDPTWEDMDAHKVDVQVRVTKSHCFHERERRSCNKMYRNSAQTKTGRRNERKRQE